MFSSFMTKKRQNCLCNKLINIRAIFWIKNAEHFDCVA